MQQIKAGEFLVVSHAYNMVPITERYEMVKRAYDKYAPRYEGDQRYHVRSVVKPVLKEQMGVHLRELK
jgi:hypothetical protein